MLTEIAHIFMSCHILANYNDHLFFGIKDISDETEMIKQGRFGKIVNLKINGVHLSI